MIFCNIQSCFLLSKTYSFIMGSAFKVLFMWNRYTSHGKLLLKITKGSFNKILEPVNAHCLHRIFDSFGHDSEIAVVLLSLADSILSKTVELYPLQVSRVLQSISDRAFHQQDKECYLSSCFKDGQAWHRSLSCRQ